MIRRIEISELPRQIQLPIFPPRYSTLSFDRFWVASEEDREILNQLVDPKDQMMQVEEDIRRRSLVQVIKHKNIFTKPSLNFHRLRADNGQPPPVSPFLRPGWVPLRQVSRCAQMHFSWGPPTRHFNILRPRFSPRCSLTGLSSSLLSPRLAAAPSPSPSQQARGE